MTHWSSAAAARDDEMSMMTNNWTNVLGRRRAAVFYLRHPTTGSLARGKRIIPSRVIGPGRPAGRSLRLMAHQRTRFNAVSAAGNSLPPLTATATDAANGYQTNRVRKVHLLFAMNIYTPVIWYTVYW